MRTKLAISWLVLGSVLPMAGCGDDGVPDGSDTEAGVDAARDGARDADSSVPDARADTARADARDGSNDDADDGAEDAETDVAVDGGLLDPMWVPMTSAPFLLRALRPENAYVAEWGACTPAAAGCEELSMDERYVGITTAVRATTTLPGERPPFFLGTGVRREGRIEATQLYFEPDEARVIAAWRHQNDAPERTSFAFSATEGANVAFEVAYDGNISDIYHVPLDELGGDPEPVGRLTRTEQPGIASIARMMVSDTTAVGVLPSAGRMFVFEDGRRVMRGRDTGEVGLADGPMAGSLGLIGRRLVWIVRRDVIATAADLDAPAEVLYHSPDGPLIWSLKTDGVDIIWTTRTSELMDAEDALWHAPFVTDPEMFRPRRVRTLETADEPYLADGRIAYRARDPGRVYLVDLDTGRQRVFDLPGDLNPGGLVRVSGDEVIVRAARGDTSDSRLFRLDFSAVPYDDE